VNRHTFHDATAADCRARDPTGPIRLRVDAGPDAGRTLRVDGDSVVLGRARGPGRIADPCLEAHHLLVHTSGRRAVQLAGRISARVDGSPIGRGATIRGGSVIEIGSTRIAVVSTADDPVGRRVAAGEVVLGVGRRDHDVDRTATGCEVLSFAEVAAIERSRELAPISIDLRTTRRLLVTGPSADGLVRSIIGQDTHDQVVVTHRADDLRSRPRRGRVLIVIDPDPDVGWPGDEPPPDGAVISVGASWEATLWSPTPDGAWAVVRFHAAGRPGRRRARASLGGRAHGRTGRSSLSR
jgi:hypothetical protein